MDATSELVKSHHPKIYSRDLIDALFKLPYCRIATLVEHGIAKRQTAAVYLDTLTQSGVLNELKLGRDKLFVNWRYSDLLYGDDDDSEPNPGPTSR